MPVLRKYLDRDGFYVITSIKGSVVTYQLSPEGAEKLRKAGINPGDKFNRFVLLDLYQSGDIFTGHSGTDEAAPSVHSGQGELDFKNDPVPESAMPVCSSCTSPYDLNLVYVGGDEHYAAILCADCRNKTTGIDSSIPLPLVSRKILSRFLTLKNIQKEDASVLAYKELLDKDFSKKWENLRRKKPIQETLLTKADPQGSLL
ncbi:MAG: hypothetical protein NT178_08365 [Proteobacteria bacterium]|nr:hypothetical protein [Pseudomonadota bacterium]